jgi:hypothetical protein
MQQQMKKKNRKHGPKKQQTSTKDEKFKIY